MKRRKMTMVRMAFSYDHTKKEKRQLLKNLITLVSIHAYYICPGNKAASFFSYRILIPGRFTLF
jgi:hypothetical protein